jgi:DNA polymerase III delta' subunit
VSVWLGLRDQDRVIARLRRAIERGRVPHAYLFAGPPGAPMYDAAIALASALSCQLARGEGCDAGADARCDACAKIAAGIHPDVVTLAREGAAQIVPIESVRNQVIARLGLPPHEGEVRVFIVEEATSMAPPAANALLKTLEEPPARTLFVLCTTAPEQLLPTIRSRCQRVRFGGGAAVAADADPARAERVAALGAELAADRHDPSLPSRIAETKGDAAPVLVAAAQVLHGRAHAAAAAHDLDAARRASARAQAILSWHIAVSIHNANPVLAIDALIAQLDLLPALGAEVVP